MNVRPTLHCLLAVLSLNAVKGNDQNSSGVCSGAPGIPGIPGTPGQSGMPGRDGLQGLKGSDGTKGAKGDKGAIGLMGPKGSLGEQGPIGVGQRGIKGEKGVKGEPGPQEESDNASINWKQCVWKRDDNQDTGLLQECLFTKRHSSTALKVAYAANMRVECSGACCGRWYITFNGAECSGPMAIEGVVYVNINSNVHRHRQIQGFCENIPSGLIRVAVRVGDCSGYGTSDRASGWNSVSRITIEEYPESQVD